VQHRRLSHRHRWLIAMFGLVTLGSLLGLWWQRPSRLLDGREDAFWPVIKPETTGPQPAEIEATGSPRLATVQFKRLLERDARGRQLAEFEIVNNSSTAITVPVWDEGGSHAAHVGYEHQTSDGWQKLEIWYDSIPQDLVVLPGDRRSVEADIGVFEFQGVKKSDLVRVLLGKLVSEPFRLSGSRDDAVTADDERTSDNRAIENAKRMRRNLSENADRMKLSIAADELQDFAHLRVRLDVRNLGRAAIAWDSEAAVFLFFSVIDESGERIQLREKDLLPHPNKSDWRKRFISIAPGESVSKIIEFSQALKSFNYGVGILELGEETITVYETTLELDVPAKVETVRVRAIYECGQGGTAAFFDWFGQTVEDVGLPTTRVMSNEIAIRRAQQPDK
jgi:hypothetical protein